MSDSTSTPHSPRPADENRLPSPGYAALWFLLFAALYMVGAVLYFAGYGAVIGFQNPELAQSPEFQSIVEQRAQEHAMTAAGMTGMYLTQLSVLLPFVLWASHFRTQHLKQTLAFTMFRASDLGVWLAVLAGFVVFEIAATAALDVPAAEFMESINGSRNLVLSLVIVFAAPFLEEMIFRGYLFKAWRRTRLGLSGTLIVTSVLFVLLHLGQYHWMHMAFLFILSVILGLAREKTGSLWVPIILHAANNLLPAVVVVYFGML